MIRITCLSPLWVRTTLKTFDSFILGSYPASLKLQNILIVVLLWYQLVPEIKEVVSHQ